MSSKTDNILEAWGSFFIAHALAIKKIESALNGKAPLSLDEYDVLLGIIRSKNSKIRYSDLASATVFTRSGITRIATRLQKRGYLQRIKCSEDRRGVYASLTIKGKKAMQETWALYSKEIILLLEPCFNQTEAFEFKKYLEKIIYAARGSPLVQIKKYKKL